MVCEQHIHRQVERVRTRRKHRMLRASAGVLACCLAFAAVLMGQTAEPWQREAQEKADAQDWDGALRAIDGQLAQYPNDMDVRAFRARVLTWAGRLVDAEKEYGEITKNGSSDPDVWMGLAELHLRQGRLEEALREANRAVEMDPKRADLRTSRGQILRAMGERREAQGEFRRALNLDPTSLDARSGLFSLRGEGAHEIRLGMNNDLLSFAPANHDQWVSFAAKWTPHWATNLTASTYQRGGANAGGVIASVTGSARPWGAVTIGGGTNHDSGVVPRTEGFFELDHGFKTSEDGFVRGVEVIYGQHWYWYSTARILTLNETAVFYLPRDWSWSLGITQARSHFSTTGIDWKPSGISRLSFPLHQWSQRGLSGNIFYAVGTEDFAQVDQIGSFASQTYGGGLRFRFTPRQDITGFAAFQQRTRNQAQTSFGFTYGFRF